MLAQHARLAAAADFPADDVLLVEDGDVLSLTPSGLTGRPGWPPGAPSSTATGPVRWKTWSWRDRRRLSTQGIVVPIVVLDRRTGRLESPPEIVTRGVVEGQEAAEISDEAGRILTDAIEGRPANERVDLEMTRERVRKELRRFLRRRTQRRPVVIPVVMEI